MCTEPYGACERPSPCLATRRPDMKLEMFHLMPYRELPEDFREKHHSAWVDVPGSRMYNDTLDELELAAAAGYDGVCVNEHHQNAYGFMPSPNIMAATLARRTRD